MPVLSIIEGGLIVSCQAYPGEPLDAPGVAGLMVQSVVAGGARAVRVEGLTNIGDVVALSTVPVIGIVKEGKEGVFITPTSTLVQEVVACGVQIVALDGTRRPRPDGLTLAETVQQLREVSDVLVMADCGSRDDALWAEDAEVDIVGTTLAGYTGERPATIGPDFELVQALVSEIHLPIVAEGRVETPEHYRKLINLGAFAVCVGSAITHPTRITRRFLE